MKTLYLIRHAKSSWDDPSLTDFDRPLNNRGKKDAPKMGKQLAQGGHRPDILLSSPAKRAWNTAKKIAKVLGFSKEDIAKDPKLYHADVSTLLTVVQSQDDQGQSLMLFGHNPGLTEFATLLCKHEFGNIPTAGVVCINFEVSSWKDVQYHRGKLQFFDYPKKHQPQG